MFEMNETVYHARYGKGFVINTNYNAGGMPRFKYLAAFNGGAQIYFDERGRQNPNDMGPSIFTKRQAKLLGLKITSMKKLYQIIVKEGKAIKIHPELFETQDDARKISGFIGFTSNNFTVAIEEDLE